jgi:N-acyl-L-homoserine lactone synthetase
MNVLARIRAGGREIEYGVATTDDERAAVQAQRFRVYQRRGYYRPDLHADRDTYDDTAASFLATLPDDTGDRILLGSARLILGEATPEFRFLTERAFEFELPAALRDIAPVQRFEVSRMVAEAVQGVIIGGLMIPLGLIQAISEYTRPLDVRCGLAVIKLRLLRALKDLGVRLHEIQPARLIYPVNGPMSGYYHRHPDPVVPVWWRVEEIAPSVERAIAGYHEARE